MVLVHGLTDNGLCWARLATALASRFDIVMLDARGHGASSRILDGECHDPGADVADAIRNLGLDDVVVIGHSVGARAAAICAGIVPERILKLILEDPPLLPLTDQATKQKRRQAFREHAALFHAMSEAEIAAKGKAESPHWHEDDFPAWAESKKQVDVEAYPQYAQPWQDTLARILAPALLIHGEAEMGSLVTSQIIDEAKSVNPRLHFAKIEGAGHNIRRERFSDYLGTILEFLADP